MWECDHFGFLTLHNGKIEGISEFATFFLQKTGPFHITRPHKSSETYWNFSQMTKVRIVHQVCLKFTSFSDFCQIFLLLMPCPFKHRLWEIFLYKMLDYLYSFESHIQYQDFGICYVKIVQFEVVWTRPNALYPLYFPIVHCKWRPEIVIPSPFIHS